MNGTEKQKIIKFPNCIVYKKLCYMHIYIDKVYVQVKVFKRVFVLSSLYHHKRDICWGRDHKRFNRFFLGLTGLSYTTTERPSHHLTTTATSSSSSVYMYLRYVHHFQTKEWKFLERQSEKRKKINEIRRETVIYFWADWLSSTVHWFCALTLLLLDDYNKKHSFLLEHARLLRYMRIEDIKYIKQFVCGVLEE